MQAALFEDEFTRNETGAPFEFRRGRDRQKLHEFSSACVGGLDVLWLQATKAAKIRIFRPSKAVMPPRFRRIQALALVGVLSVLSSRSAHTEGAGLDARVRLLRP